MSNCLLCKHLQSYITPRRKVALECTVREDFPYVLKGEIECDKYEEQEVEE